VKRFLLDEKVALASARRLRDAGHDVARPEPGASDQSLLERASTERRILVTYDGDFGFLLFRVASPLPAGLVYVRSAPGRIRQRPPRRS
jgi:predicted nuclease of predicted toxin-antitoxin system